MDTPAHFMACVECRGHGTPFPGGSLVRGDRSRLRPGPAQLRARVTSPLAPGSYSVPYANCYRCPFEASHPECSFLCVEFLRKFIRHNTSGCIAAILVEPIQGTAGNVVPPPGFLKALQQVAREAEALLITDEIITGFGRTGKMFCVEHEGIVPDIMTLGKGMGGGFPVSGLISTDEIVAAKPFSMPSASSSSYGVNPLAAAACLVTLETIQEDLRRMEKDKLYQE